MRQISQLFALAVVALGPFNASGAQPQRTVMDPTVLQEMLPEVGYSATRIMEYSGPDVPPGSSMQSKVYYQPRMERNEMNFGGFSTVTIIRYDTEVLWIYNPMLGQVSEMPFTNFRTDDGQQDFETLEPSGTTTRDGRTLTVYNYSRTDTDGTNYHGSFYLTEENIPYRQEITFEQPGQTTTTMVMQLSNLILGDQPADLFAKPAATSGGVTGIPNLSELLRQAQAGQHPNAAGTAGSPAGSTSTPTSIPESTSTPASTPVPALAGGAKPFPVGANGSATFSYSNPSGSAVPLTVALADVELSSGQETVYWRSLTPLQGPDIAIPLKGLLSDNPALAKQIIVYDTNTNQQIARYQPTLTTTVTDIATEAATDVATEVAKDTAQKRVGRFFKKVFKRD